MKVKKISWENIILPHTVTYEDGTVVVYEWDSPVLDRIMRECYLKG